MKKLIASVFICFIFMSDISGGAADIIDRNANPDIIKKSPLTLADCYGLALKRSENIAIDAEYIKQTEAHFLQALSIIMPHASFQSLDFQQADNTLEATPSSGASSLGSGLKSSVRNFNVTQTLFNGFKAFAAIRASKFEKNQRMKEKERAEQLLLVDVSDAFYLLIEKQEDIKALNRIKKALMDRVRELQERERLGRSRASEVVNAKTQLYIVESNLQLAVNQETLARQLLEFLVGGIFDKLLDTYEVPSSLMPESYYVSKYVVRPDVEAAKQAWEVAKKEVKIAESDFLPTVSVGANYYTQRTGLDKGTDWDVTLNISVPIFEGTEVIGNVKEASSKARQSELSLIRIRRYAPYDIKDAYTQLKTAIEVHNSLKKAFKTARLNYYLQRKDYSRSLVNNLEVLASIQTLENSQRDYIHALYEAKRLYWDLRVTVGESMTERLYESI